jgi:hypothetical protein
MIVGITGRKGAGKNSACDNLQGWSVMSFASPLKEVCCTVFGLTTEEMMDPNLKELPLGRWPYETPRSILQKVGTEIFRDYYPDVWVQNLKNRIANNLYDDIAVTDVRFENEAKAIRELGGYIVRVERPGLQKTDLHSSELEMDRIRVDATIINDGSVRVLQARFEAAVFELDDKK